MNVDPSELPERMTALLRERRGALAALARAEGLGPEDAVDCVQEGSCTLWDLLRAGALAEEPAQWPAVLAGIVRNAARNRRRRHDRARPHEELDAHPELRAEEGLPELLLERAEEHLRLQLCVAQLCEVQRAVVTLRLLEERGGEDVARALGLTPGYVAVLLHRARRSLRECMA